MYVTNGEKKTYIFAKSVVEKKKLMDVGSLKALNPTPQKKKMCLGPPLLIKYNTKMYILYTLLVYR